MDGRFPFDWLAPGELRFCPAGWHLTPAPCPACSSEMGLDAHRLRWQQACQLAATRRQDGVPRLFWMARQ
jgi:hypothetical protein